ncbi:flavin-containing monooxygenase [Candidatus Mycolicibacterium alkanivorans]|uniref:NAD(P)/FAD-dependent oxidoreductase n=1 Tax=Candidatus Mycolicibacterium alkanivorans TaxID=2954114 RepID=A0ABS9Z1R5_9MYCO|nr:NAD(P)/FAD-dependent oxidoreductase [Candidatus Mycolicibacterium alkanivorans]MCI4676464.1 NAD(P)/FAD-dependent oxidoreductase [Candidatus Mycolicibacterium alkanivorans]
MSTHHDAIVIGAGFGGMYALKKLRDEHGLNVRLFDKAGGVGGTWYWNRYPGALSDTESFVYCYSCDKDLLKEWDFNTRYVTQPQILSYLEHVADRWKLRPDIQLNTGVVAAHFHENDNLWHVKTDTGELHTAKYLVTAVGLLSATNLPDLKGIDTFQGVHVHTSQWPADLELAGKRVGVIGNGSTGVQVITAIAPEVDHLTVFQRSAQFTVPVGNGPVSREYVADVKENYEAIWEQVRNSVVAFGFEESTTTYESVSSSEALAIFERAWEKGGGFRFMFETFADIATNEVANKAAQDFIKGKIAEIVKDPETARKLMPRDLYAKRPLCDSGYYATFNRDNVELVDVKENPIAEITPAGVRTSDGVEHQIDILIFATGFDAVDGNYKRFDLRGRNGLTMADYWKDGPSSYLGVAVANFPNMFMVLGPNGPFTNLPPSIETQVEWSTDLIGHVEQTGFSTVEPTADAEQDWTATCREVADATLFPKAQSWIFGANIPGKKNTVYFYLAGLGAYRNVLSECKDAGYKGFQFS